MKKIGKIILWILGILVWYMFYVSSWAGDTNNRTNAHQLILIITGILLAIYLLRGKTSEANALEKENQALKADIQKLRKELEAQQTVAAAIEKSEKKRED